MKVKTSKEATDRQKAFIFLHSVFLLQGPKVAAEMVEFLQSEAPSPSPEKGAEAEAAKAKPGFLSVILGFGRALGQRLERLVAADETHYKEKAVYSALLKKRDRLTGDVIKLVVALRRIVLGEHEDPDMGQLGFEGETAREAVPLLRQADRIVEVLASGDIDAILGPPIFTDSTFEPKDRGKQLEKKAAKLARVVTKVGDAKRRTEDAFLAKQEATSAYDLLFLRAARIFEDSCRLVGRDELADRIRPSEKRPGRTQVPPPENPEEAADQAADAGDSDGETESDAAGSTPEPAAEGTEAAAGEEVASA